MICIKFFLYSIKNESINLLQAIPTRSVAQKVTFKYFFEVYSNCNLQPIFTSL